MANPGQRMQSIDPDLSRIVASCQAKAAQSNKLIAIDDARKDPIDTWPGKHHGVARLYKDCGFDNYTGNPKLVAGIRRIAQTQESIVLFGPTGCGKTHLAVAIVREQRQRYLIVTVPDMLLKIRSTYNQDMSEEDAIAVYASVPVLVLDDLGAEKASDFSVERVQIILDRRIRQCLRTIITTNLPWQAIEDTYGARIASRMASMVNIKISMPDFRKKRGNV